MVNYSCLVFPLMEAGFSGAELKSVESSNKDFVLVGLAVICLYGTELCH